MIPNRTNPLLAIADTLEEAAMFQEVVEATEWRDMADLERGERLQIMLSGEELTAVENFRYEKRMPSRASAVRELLRRGLAAEGFLTATPGTKSQDFGVIGQGENANDDS